MINISFYVDLRSPSVTTVRDIDPKLPAARHNLDGYPLSDGEWRTDSRCVLAQSDAETSKYIFFC